MNEYLETAIRLLCEGGVFFFLAKTFLRTKEQKGVDVANMVSETSKAFKETLDNVMNYNKEVISELRGDAEIRKARYDELQGEYRKLSLKLENNENDRSKMEMLLSEAYTCKHLRGKSYESCPIISGNCKRIADKCKSCAK